MADLGIHGWALPLQRREILETPLVVRCGMLLAGPSWDGHEAVLCCNSSNNSNIPPGASRTLTVYSLIARLVINLFTPLADAYND